ncbi:C40 family peptidase [Candidatus Pelagibacter sp.]|nr:C40 family peptidase [Candidatus Pelagibacter sp.]
MTELYSTSIIRNIYKKPSKKSEVTSQIIYGEKVRILEIKKKWLRIKTLSDNYSGFIKNEKLQKGLKILFKTNKFKTRIFSKNKKKNFLTFNSRLPIIAKRKKFIEFEKGKWVKRIDIKPINHKDRNFVKILKSFINCKYTWGGKSYKGIDCSALIQLYYLYNNKFFPRDTKDQISFKKGKKNIIKFSKGDIIYWRGHVAVCLNKSQLIHAYGPRKKVLTMNIKKTIELIKETAKLEIKKIIRV